MENNSNIIKRYDDLLYDNRPATLNEYINNKYNIIHKELYDSALNKYIYTLIDKYIDSKFIYELFGLFVSIPINSLPLNDFDLLYAKIFSIINDNNYVINTLLNNLSIDRISFFNVIHNAILQKLNSIKNQFINLVNDDSIFNYIKFMFLSDFEEEPFNIVMEYNIETNSFIINNDIEIDDIKVNYNKLYESNNDIIIQYYNENEEIIPIKGKFIIKINKNIDDIISFINYESNIFIDLYKENICKLYKRYHKIIESKQSEYWMPSSIIIINKIAPYKKSVVKLDKYWNNIQSYKNYNINDIKISKDNILDSEIINLDYVNGNATMHAKSTDVQFNVSFKYLDENTNVGDELLMNNSFIEKYNSL